jgi:hypothetical protein
MDDFDVPSRPDHADPRAVARVGAQKDPLTSLRTTTVDHMSYEMLLDVPIRMADGVTLAANVWVPKSVGPAPVLLTRTPYGKDAFSTYSTAAPNIFELARNGYAVVLQDCWGTARHVPGRMASSCRIRTTRATASVLFNGFLSSSGVTAISPCSADRTLA